MAGIDVTTGKRNPDEPSATDAANRNNAKPLWYRLAWLPIPLLIVIMAVFADVNMGDIHDSPSLRFALNFAFSTLVSSFIAYLVGRSFLARSTPGLLLLGCGVVIWGLAAVTSLVVAGADTNVIITIFTLGTWLAALCHLAGVFLSLRPRRALHTAGIWLASGYAVALLALVLISIFTVEGRLPFFFIQGQGGTPVRHLVLGSAVAMFALAAILLRMPNRKSLSTFTYWYSYGLALLAVGLGGTLFPSSFSSALFWTARATQWLGGVYMMIAAIASVRESHAWGISLEQELRQQTDLLRLSFDAIIVWRLGGVIESWNRGAEQLYGYSESEALGSVTHELLKAAHPVPWPEIEASLRESGNWEGELRHITKEGREVVVSARHQFVVGTDGVERILETNRDITERKRAEEEREATIEFLRLVNRSRGTRDLVQRATTFFQQRSCCEAVGIRLQEGGDYPYFEYRGFSKEFVLAENLLCKPDENGLTILDNTGHPALDCMCGNVIRGRFDPSKPFFTVNGSFWTNDTTRLLASTTDADRQARTRNRCNGEGYESVALIALRVGEQRLGLLQLNDRQKGRFSLETILLWERLAGYLAAALSKFRAEEALRVSEQQFRELAEGIPQLAWTANPDGWIYWYNQRWYQYTGTTSQQMEGWGWQSVHDPNELPRVMEQWKVSIASGEQFDMVFPLRGADGAFRPFLTRVMPLRDSQGRVVRWFGTNTDISDQHRAQEELQLAKRHAEDVALQLRSIVENMAERLFVCDSKGYPILMNAAFRRTYPGTEAPEYPQTFAEQWEAFDMTGNPVPVADWPIGLALRGQKVRGAEFRTRSKLTGKDMISSYTASPVFDSQGKVMMALFTSQDIAERKRAEEALRISQERLTAIIGSAMDAIITIGTDHCIVVFNVAAEKIFGCPAAEAIGHPLDRFIPAMFRETHREHVQAFARTGTTNRSMYSPGMLFGVRANGEEFPLEATISQVTVGDQTLYTVILRDVTQRKQAEQALLRSEKLASVGRMAATIAHEINNPLEAVTNLLFIAKSVKDPESACQYLDMADAELKRIAHITRQSLGFYRESNAPAVTSVNAVLDSAVELLKNKIKAKDAVIEKQWDGDVQITALAGELRQVFSNLLVNSLDAIDANGTIKLRVSTGAALNNGHRWVRVTIADNGKGISPSSRQHLFEPFFTTKGTVGTGLGLWVSKQIIEKHGGTIRVRSSNNGALNGTVFSVVLPIEPAAAAASQTTGA